MTGEADRRWSKASSGSNGDRQWRGDSGRGEAELGVGEGGGGAGEDVRARNRSMVPEEGDRRKEATAARADELRSSLVEVGMRKEEMTTGPTSS